VTALLRLRGLPHRPGSPIISAVDGSAKCTMTSRPLEQHPDLGHTSQPALQWPLMPSLVDEPVAVTAPEQTTRGTIQFPAPRAAERTREEPSSAARWLARHAGQQDALFDLLSGLEALAQRDRVGLCNDLCGRARPAEDVLPFPSASGF
jgi:hypothetical protein